MKKKYNTEHIFTKIAESVATKVGETFFHSLTYNLTDILDADYCLLGRSGNENPETCTIVSAFSRPDDSYLDMEYDILNSAPAEAAYRNGKTACFPDKVRKLFPFDNYLNVWNINAYAAVPLLDVKGKSCGILIILSRRKFEEPEILLSVLQILAQRAAGEMQRLRYENQLVAERNRADEMNTLKNNFLTNMSHEVRTPLNTIIGFSNLLKEEISGEQQQKYLRYIEEGGYRLLQTIDDILDISVLETSPASLEFQKTDLESEIDLVLGYFGNVVRDKKILLKKNVHSSGIIVRANPGMIGQVLRKLIDNAVKFTSQGSILVTLDSVIRNEKKYGIIRITDTGIGIDEEFLPQIFDEFRQESRGLGRMYEGVGLGLTIVKKMINLMDGFIEVESKKDNGSTFTVFLPFDS